MTNSNEMKTEVSVEKLKAWLSFVSSFRWPAVLLIFLVVFKPQIAGLTNHIRPNGSAPVQFEFPQAAAGHISANINALVKESDPGRRSELAEKIQASATMLGSIHPRSLGIFITGAGGNYIWVGDLYFSKKEYFDQLEESGLVKVQKSRRNEDVYVSLKYTPGGIGLLKSIGFEQSELEGIAGR